MAELTEMVIWVLAAAMVAVATWWGWEILEWIWLKPKRMEKLLRYQGYVGNPYKVLFGDLKEFSFQNKLARSTPISLSDYVVPRVLPFHHKTIEKYGKKSFIWFGTAPRIQILEPELIREVLTKNFNYLKPKANPLTKLLITGLINYEHDKWVMHRKIINPAFHSEKIKLMLPAFHVSCVEMINAWEKVVEESKEVDVWPYIQTLTADVISRTAFGSSYEEGRKIFQLLKIQMNLVVQAISSLYIPGWRFMPTRRNLKMKKIARQLNSLLTDIINKRISDVLKANETINNQDLLGLLLESNFRNDDNGKGKYGKMMGMTINDIIDECKLFYLAGQETTGVLLIWTIILLAHHQKWQQKARDEVLGVFGKHNKPNFQGLNHLKIVTMILYEVLRLYPPTTQFNRSIDTDIKLGESLNLQAGTMITIPIIVLHWDKKIWGEDAKEFNPYRFAEGISKATNGEQCAYLPFGMGPRVCIGQNFALLEAKMAITMILQRYSFELSPLYVHAPLPFITIQPQFGAPVILHKI